MPQKRTIKKKAGTKKTGIKKFNSKLNQPLQVRHEREGNLNYYSEEVAKSLIEKLISLAITTQNKNRIYAETGNMCFNYIKKEISNYIQIQFISYDRDDMLFSETNQMNNSLALTEDIIPISKVSNDQDRDENNQLNHLSNIIPFHLDTHMFYDVSFDKENFWGEIPHPSTTVKDRDAGTQIGYQKFNPDKTIKDENESLSKSIKPTEKTSLNGLRVSLMKKNSLSLSYHFSNLNEPQGKKKVYPINFPAYDIPTEKIPKRNELPEISQLREEREMLIKEKHNEEIKKRQKIEELKQEKIKTNYPEKKKKYGNYTVDSQGKIVVIKSIPIELLQDEFTVGKSEQKEIELIKDSTLSLNSSSKFDSYNKNKSKKEEVIYNSNANEITDKSNTKNQNKGSSSITAAKPLPNKIIRKMENSKFAIAPSGSNFDLIHPEIGVTILEESKIKSGGKDYLRKYNKFSVENFNQTLKDTLYNQSINNFDSTKGFLKKTSDITINQHQSNMNSPQKMQTFDENNKQNYEYHKQLNKSQSTGNIIMSSFKYPSIQSAINTLDLLNEREEHYDETKNKTSYIERNLFANMKRMNYDKFNRVNKEQNINNNLGEINKFTRTLMSNSHWGKVIPKRDSSSLAPRNYIKPQQKDIEREMGMGITMTRLPRSRMKLAAQNVLMSSSAINFNLGNQPKVRKNKPKKNTEKESN